MDHSGTASMTVNSKSRRVPSGYVLRGTWLLQATKQVQLIASHQKKRHASTAPLKSLSSQPKPLPPQRQLLCLREGGNMLSSKDDAGEHDADAYQDKKNVQGKLS